MNLINFTIPDLYDTLNLKDKDPLAIIKDIIDWEAFRPIFNKLYLNKKGVGGRPNFDPVMMMKILFLASINNMTDEQTEFAIHDRISYRVFLGNPDKLPDRTTIWTFRERLIKSNISDEIWDCLLKQIEAKGYKILEGKAQDATFIDADPGHKKVDTPRGDEAKTRRSRDGSFTKKYNRTHFGYKLHTLVEIGSYFITKFLVTTAKLHDSKVDLSDEDDILYRDKGYFGTHPKGHSATMKRGVRNHPITQKDKLRNNRISKKRNCVEMPYAKIKKAFHGDRTLVTTVERVSIKSLFLCFSYNAFHLDSLLKGIKKNQRKSGKKYGVAFNTNDLFQSLEF